MLTGRYAPGDRLPGQRAMAAELGVNMATAREAIKRLEQLRLVEVRQGDAMRVLDWRAHGGLDVLIHAAQQTLDPATLRDVMEARRALLAEAGRLAAQRRSPEQAALLGSLVGELAAAGDDRTAQGLDFAFYAVLIEAAGNVVYQLIANTIRDVYFEHLGFFRALVSGRGELVPLYERAARAVADGEADAAAAAVGELADAQWRRLG